MGEFSLAAKVNSNALRVSSIPMTVVQFKHEANEHWRWSWLMSFAKVREMCAAHRPSLPHYPNIKNDSTPVKFLGTCGEQRTMSS